MIFTSSFVWGLEYCMHPCLFDLVHDSKCYLTQKIGYSSHQTCYTKGGKPNALSSEANKTQFACLKLSNHDQLFLFFLPQLSYCSFSLFLAEILESSYQLTTLE